jgi:hypothetical protein
MERSAEPRGLGQLPRAGSAEAVDAARAHVAAGTQILDEMLAGGVRVSAPLHPRKRGGGVRVIARFE